MSIFLRTYNTRLYTWIYDVSKFIPCLVLYVPEISYAKKFISCQRDGKKAAGFNNFNNTDFCSNTNMRRCFLGCVAHSWIFKACGGLGFFSLFNFVWFVQWGEMGTYICKQAFHVRLSIIFSIFEKDLFLISFKTTFIFFALDRWM